MTIQQGTSTYIYPLTDNVLPVVRSVFAGVQSHYGTRAWLRSVAAPNAYKGALPWTEARVTVLELNDRYVGFLPYKGDSYPISSEANPAIHEGGPLIFQAAAEYKLRMKDTDYRDQVGYYFLRSLYGLGWDKCMAVDKVTAQSVVEHYLFGTGPTRVRDLDDRTLDYYTPVVSVIGADSIAEFVARMALYKQNGWGIDHLYSDIPELVCDIYTQFPAIPKLETDRWLGGYDINALVAYYHGLMMDRLTVSQQQDYIAGNWSNRIRYLVRSAVFCQYFWSVRFKQAYPVDTEIIPMLTELNIPMLMEDGTPMLLDTVREVWTVPAVS